jgi:peroxiredoxin
LLVGSAVTWAWFHREPPLPKGSAARSGYGVDFEAGSFKDQVQTNTNFDAGAMDLSFPDSKGKALDLAHFRGHKNLVLIVTRGFPGYICPNCTAQTARLITHYAEFTQRNAEVLVVFPGPKESVAEFVQISQTQAANRQVPFPILLDEKLAVVDRLGLRADLAKPSTFILDKKGQVRFAYVGTTSSDRPSIKALLQQLELLEKPE